MARIKKRGESGAAKNYITRNQAVKKLQISLADFRRLCILKGIYPREPLHKKRVNKGSTAPASFYYHKDIQYLLHEPLLQRFREHKAFAKKLARAVGRKEWGLAENLQKSKPIAKLDHIVKERYPTFTLALQDMQDPLNLVHLFSTLPSNPSDDKKVPSEVIHECSRLISEWKVWAIKTHSLRKVFLGIKGVYYECSVPGHGGEAITVRWMEGYEFQQFVPHDVDFRILLTFLELYRTLLSFVLFKLYTEENLIYPPHLDAELDERGESVGAFKLAERSETKGVNATGVSRKEVKKAIQAVKGSKGEEDVEMDEADTTGENGVEEDFVERPHQTLDEDVSKGSLTTYNSIIAGGGPSRAASLLFAPYTFYLSRETSSRTWEFVIRAMGGNVVTASQSPELEGAASDRITHVIVDRSMTNERMREMEKGRKWVWVQPQWVADCVNRGKVLGAEEYKPGHLLPPHLSPWDGEGEISRPWLEASRLEGADGEAAAGEQAEDAEEEDEEEADEEEGSEEDDEEDEEEDEEAPAFPPALLASAQNPSDAALLHAAELEAETSGTSHAAFLAQRKEAIKQFTPAKSSAPASKFASGKNGEEDLRKIMMSNKKARLYEKMKYSNREKQEQKDKLEAKRLAIEKRKRKEGKGKAGKA